MKKSAKSSLVGSLLIVLLFGFVYFSVFLRDNMPFHEYIPAVNVISAKQAVATGEYHPPEQQPDDYSEKLTKISALNVYDLNLATAEQLEAIDGIGSALAQRIVSYRNEHGRFNSIEELLNVKGIGKAKLAAIRNSLYVEFVAEYYTSFSALDSSAATTSEFTQTVPAALEESTVPKVIYLSDDESFNAEQQKNTFPIELNSATKEELTRIDGVGEALAQRIVDYAHEKGFYSVEDLMNVSGIGEYKYNALKQYVYVDTAKYSSGTGSSSKASGGLTETASVTTTKPAPSLPIELNSATLEELTWLPGVNDTMAVRIIVYAEQYGFYSVDDLLKVSGIGEAKLEKIRPYVYVDTSSLPQKSTVTTATPETTAYKPSLPIELNSATIEELTWLPEIGETTAIKIIVYAQQYGFYSVDDLLNVSGIGKAKLEKIKPYICVDASGLPPKTSETSATTSKPKIVNINTCTKQELLAIDGINEALADNIIITRSKIEVFSCLEELFLVDGMTEKIYCKITPYLCI